MAEIRTVTTLRFKRDEIIHSIRLYERQLEQARADLAVHRCGHQGRLKAIAPLIDCNRSRSSWPSLPERTIH